MDMKGMTRGTHRALQGLVVVWLIVPWGASSWAQEKTAVQISEPRRGPSLAADPTPDSSGLATVLGRHVSERGVDYAGLKANADSRRLLAAFLRESARMSESASLAHWLNVYNARVLQLVVQHYPIDSVRSVPGFFDRLTLDVAGKPRTLDALENEVIRKRFADARVHVALHCAAASCPPLHPEPFAPSTLDATLGTLARATVASSRHVRLERGVLYHSKIFEWFEPDFVRDAGSVLAWIQRYSRDPAIRALPEGTRRVSLAYDWALADAR